MEYKKLREKFTEHLVATGKGSYSEQDLLAYVHDENQKNIRAAIGQIRSQMGNKMITYNDLLAIFEKLQG